MKDDLTYRIIGCCYEVHKTLGSGFLERVYQEALCAELNNQFFDFRKEALFPVVYKSESLGVNYCADILVEDEVVIELKALDKLTKSHYAQCINYLKVTGLKVCLLVNFGIDSLEVRRVVV